MGKSGTARSIYDGSCLAGNAESGGVGQSGDFHCWGSFLHLHPLSTWWTWWTSSSATTVSGAQAGCHGWRNDGTSDGVRRWLRRAVELAIPDPTLLVGALEKMGTTLTHQSAQASSFMSSARILLQIDVNPTVQGVTSYADVLLAEAESAFHGVSQQTTAKVKSVEVSPTPKTGGTGLGATPEGKKPTPSSTTATKQIPCKYFLQRKDSRRDLSALQAWLECGWQVWEVLQLRINSTHQEGLWWGEGEEAWRCREINKGRCLRKGQEVGLRHLKMEKERGRRHQHPPSRKKPRSALKKVSGQLTWG